MNKEEDLKESEKLISLSSASVSYWYENYYLITESFRVKDKDSSLGNKKKEYVQFKKILIQQ